MNRYCRVQVEKAPALERYVRLMAAAARGNHEVLRERGVLTA